MPGIPIELDAYRQRTVATIAQDYDYEVIVIGSGFRGSVAAMRAVENDSRSV